MNSVSPFIFQGPSCFNEFTDDIRPLEFVVISKSTLWNSNILIIANLIFIYNFKVFLRYVMLTTGPLLITAPSVAVIVIHV